MAIAITVPTVTFKSILRLLSQSTLFRLTPSVSSPLTHAHPLIMASENETSTPQGIVASTGIGQRGYQLAILSITHFAFRLRTFDELFIINANVKLLLTIAVGFVGPIVY